MQQQKRWDKTASKHCTSQTTTQFITHSKVGSLCSNTVWIFKYYPEPSVREFAHNWHREKMYSLWFTPTMNLHAWPNAFCPHPETGLLSWGIGCPHGALSVSWSGPESSLVHPRWKPQMRCSTNAFIFIWRAQDKVSGSFCASDMVMVKDSPETRCFHLYL